MKHEKAIWERSLEKPRDEHKQKSILQETRVFVKETKSSIGWGAIIRRTIVVGIADCRRRRASDTTTSTINERCTRGSGIGTRGDARARDAVTATVTVFVNLSVAIIVNPIATNFHGVHIDGRIIVITIATTTFTIVLEESIAIPITILETAHQMESIHIPHDGVSEVHHHQDETQVLHGSAFCWEKRKFAYFTNESLDDV